MKKNLDTRLQLLLAAQTEFAKKGFAGARIDNIAHNAKINKAMLYYYFGTKEKLYIEVMRSLFYDKKEQEIELAEICSSVTPDIKLYCAVYFFIKMHLLNEEKNFNQILAWELAEGGKNLHLIVEDLMRPATRMLEDIVNQGVKEGFFSISDVPLFVLNIFFMITGIAKQKELLRNTKCGESIFTQNYQERFFKFLMTDVLSSIVSEKALKPSLFDDLPQADLLKEQIDSIIYQKN